MLSGAAMPCVQEKTAGPLRAGRACKAELPAREPRCSLRLLPGYPLCAGDLAERPLQPRAQSWQRLWHRPHPPRLHHRWPPLSRHLIIRLLEHHACNLAPLPTHQTLHLLCIPLNLRSITDSTFAASVCNFLAQVLGTTSASHATLSRSSIHFTWHGSTVINAGPKAQVQLQGSR